MMKRKIFAFISAMCMVFSLLPINAFAKGDAGEHKKTGLRAPTEREEKLFKEKAKIVKKVLPNAQGLKRINDERIKKGLQPLSDSFAASDGEDIIPTQKSAKSENKYASILNSYSEINEVLPASVDLSQDSHFPAIGDQGWIGSCASFATTYYAATHETAVQRNINLAVQSNCILSPKFNYNINNDGEDEGSSIYGNLATLYTRGAPFIDEASMLSYQYNGYDFFSPGVVNPLQYREYPQTAAIYNDALKNRIADFGTVGSINTDSGFGQVKLMLNNSHVLILGTNYMYEWTNDNIHVQNDPSTTADDAFAGQFAYDGIVRTPDTGGHAMTVVGYNDNIWVDFNSDGNVQSNEKGALKIANSWGTVWGNNGYIWLSYNALRQTYGEGSFIDNNVFYYITAQDEYTPEATAEITVNTARRNQLWLLSGVNYENTYEPLNAYYDYVFSGDWGGPYSFAGTNTATPATVVIDLTDALYGEGFGGAPGNYNLFAGVMDSLDDAYFQQVQKVMYIYGATTFGWAIDSVPQNINDNLYWFTNNSKGNVNLTAYANPLQGSVSGGGSYPYDSTATLRAIPNEGFSFVRWIEDGETLSTNPDLILILRYDRFLTAEFKNNNYTINAYANNLAYGTVNGGGTFPYGSRVKLEAIPNEGYVFIRWVGNASNFYPPTSEYTFTVTADMDIKAEFSALDVPSLTALSGGNNRINLTCSEVNGANLYEFYYTDNAKGPFIHAGTGWPGHTTLTVNTVTGKAYYFKVRAKCILYDYKSGTWKETYGPYSSVVSSASTPATPVNLKVVQTGASSIKLTYNKVAGASKYEIWSSVSETGALKRIASISVRSYTLKKIKEGNTYYYKVRAVATYKGKKIYSDFCTPVSITIPKPAPPDIPQNLTALQAGAKSVRLSFTPAPGASKYEIYYSTKPNGKFRRLTTTSAASYTHKRLKAGRTYYYKVRAYRVVWGKKIYSGYSNTVSCSAG